MKKIALIFGLLPMAAFAESDAEIALKTALSTVKTQCGGISQSMDNLKKMAGIGTAVNAVGTAAGVGGVVSGVVKSQKDKELAQAMVEKQKVDIDISKLKALENSPENQRILAENTITLAPDAKEVLEQKSAEMDAEEGDEDASDTQDETVQTVKNDNAEKIAKLEAESNAWQQTIDKRQKESIVAGNVRTGLFAADTATNIAGAAISSKTAVDADLAEKIKACAESVESLRSLNTRVRVEDGTNANNVLLSKSENILNRCSQYEYVDVVSLNNLAKGAIVSNSIGAVTGSAAVITSALGNNKKASDIIAAGDVKKAKQYDALNASSNVLGGVTAAASLTGTVLNASQIKKIKDVVNIAAECEEALK